MNGGSHLHWTSAACTDVGPVRSRNEDAFLDQPDRGLWAVADGMGGHAFGHVASGRVVNALAAPPALPGDSLAGLAAATHARVAQVNYALRLEAAARGVRVMGSTVAVLLAHGAGLACLWAGDSRIYRYRDGRLEQLTRDHSQAEQWRAHGGAPENAPAGAAANTITRAVGAADTVALEQVTLEARGGDIYLLCSDGLSNPVDAPAIARALAGGDCAQAAQALVALAIARGGRDNITAVVVRADDDDDDDRTMVNPAL